MATSNERRVFVVDDERLIAWSLAMILRQSGFATESFTDPLEALEAARGEAPDLLISDVVMPQMSGIDLAVRIKAMYPECKVLLFSGQPYLNDVRGATEIVRHNFEVLEKPMQPREFLAKVRLEVAAGGSVKRFQNPIQCRLDGIRVDGRGEFLLC
jgi:DNA-binding NtrC family response regulator